MDGEITCDSCAGKGSTFRFDVGLGTVTERDDAALGRALTGERILVVDDNSTAREAVLELLVALGASCEAVAPGREVAQALEEASRRSEYGVVLVDGGIPEDELQTILGQVRKTPSKAVAKVVLGLPSSLRGRLGSEYRLLVDDVTPKPYRRRHLQVQLRKDSDPLADTGERAAWSSPRPLEAPEDRARVLVVEDNAVNQKVALMILDRLGVDGSVAGDGAMAVEMIAQGGFELVLMDLQMPVMDGCTATREIRKLGGRFEDMPIVAMTADAMTGARERCMEAGMNDYLCKPVRIDEVRAVLERWMKKR